MLRIISGVEQKDANFEQLRKLPRFHSAEFMFFSHPFKIIDFASFFSQYQEIFITQIYKFNSDTPHPYIVDCGANIGLSIIYFKKLYPNATIIGFEPDPKAFSTLSYNIRAFGFRNVVLVNKAIWDKRSMLRFYSEGSDGGRVAVRGDTKHIISVKTDKLNQYINRPVDFLKIDIEGAETKVLKECQSVLGNITNLFIEYHSFSSETQTLDEILKILRAHSFRYYITRVGVESRQPFVYNNTWLQMDNQLNIYATKNKNYTR